MPEKDLIALDEGEQKSEMGAETVLTKTETEAEIQTEGGNAPEERISETEANTASMETEANTASMETEANTTSMETEKVAETHMEGDTATEAETHMERDTVPEAETIMAGGTAPAELLAHPMFYPFAKGREGSLTELCRDFAEMLRAGGISVTPRMTASVSARITPDSAYAVSDVALSERQRALARAAGMTYREYYELSCDIPSSIQKNKT